MRVKTVLRMVLCTELFLALGRADYDNLDVIITLCSGLTCLGYLNVSYAIL